MCIVEQGGFMAFGLLRLLTNCTYIGSSRSRSSFWRSKSQKKSPCYTAQWGQVHSRGAFKYRSFNKYLWWFTIQRCSLRGGLRGLEPPRNLADKLTLFKPGGQIMPLTLLPTLPPSESNSYLHFCACTMCAKESVSWPYLFNTFLLFILRSLLYSLSHYFVYIASFLGSF